MQAGKIGSRCKGIVKILGRNITREFPTLSREGGGVGKFQVFAHGR
jgi:hypothetical protein